MPLRALGGDVGPVVLASVFSDPAFWAALGPAIGLLAGGIALATALIERRTAKVDRLRAEAPAARSAERIEVLPQRLPFFVDRADAIRKASEKIGLGERVLAVQGDAGVGKSAVATELFHRLHAKELDGLPDLHQHDFLWIDAQDDCPTLVDVCGQLTLQTGDQRLSAAADDAKLHALKAHLSRRRTVLLLDNVRFPPDPRGEPLHGLLDAVPDGSLVIAAVNGPHRLRRASPVVLRELDQRHVMELIQEKARRLELGDPELFDAVFAERLWRAVGGNPELIESFLQTLSRRPGSLEQLLEGVEQGDGVRELLRPLWDALPEPSRRVLTACAGLRGQANADQLAAACEMGREELSAALVELLKLEALTVVRSPGRPELYTTSHAVQRLALAEAPRESVADIARRLAAYYVRQLTREPENAQWAVPHVEGIKAVLWLLWDVHEDAELQALFASVLDVLLTLGLFDDRIATGRLAWRSAKRTRNHRAASLATDVLSSTHAARGELREAREAVALGFVAAEASGDAGERARQMRADALVLYKSCRAKEALAAMAGAEALARGTGDLEIVVNLLGLRTVAHWYAGEHKRSAAAAEEGLDVCRTMGWERAKAYPLRNLAESALRDGELDRARSSVQAARRVAAAYGDRRQLARIDLTSARMELFRGRLRASLQLAASAEAQAHALGLRPELRELRALRRAALRALLFPPLRLVYARRRPARFTDAPIGGD